MNVAVRPSEVTCPVILAPALFFRINVEVVTVVPGDSFAKCSFNDRSSCILRIMPLLGWYL